METRDEYYRCPHAPTDDPHPCPYRSDVNNDDDTLCRCCDACRHECAQDV